MKLSKQQKIQEIGYDFPYHYIPHIRNGIFYQTRNLSWGYEYLSYLNFVLKQINKKPFKSLLDIGCGDARLLFELGKIYPNHFLYGIDFSKKALKHAKSFNQKTVFILGDITNKKSINKKFDIATLIEVLEHIPSRKISVFLKGVHFLLKNKGNLILTVPCNNIPQEPKHYQHFNLVSLKKVLSCFFTIEKVFYLNKKNIKSRLIRKLLTNNLFILNNKKLLSMTYNYYQKHLLIAQKNNAKRICVIANKI